MDTRIAIWVATHRVHALDQLFVALGDIERVGLVWIVIALAVAWGRRCRPFETLTLAVTAAIATFAADALAFGVKDLTSRPRPFEAHPQIHTLYAVHSSSFPAGHAATAFAGAVLIACVAPRVAPVVVPLALVIGFSRVYVGDHYPTDILGGAAIGAPVGAAAFAGLRLIWDHVPGSRPAWIASRRNVRGHA